jgi:competence protein ComEA
MDKRRVLYFCIAAFLLGLFTGIVIGYYVIPKISSVKNDLENQSVYTIQNKCEEKKEEEIPAVVKYCVDINGAIKKPGIYCLNEGSLIKDVLDKAGGLKSTYAKEYVDRKINLALPIRNAQKIYFPFEKEMDCKLQDFKVLAKDIEDNFGDINNSSSENDSSDNDTGESDTQCVNINTATIEQLDTLDGVGPSTAQKIIDGRPYTKKEDILNISGIGEATYEKFKDTICI